MIIDKSCVSVCDWLSVTFAVKLNCPATVGVPEISPEDSLRLNPLGKFPAEMLQL